MPAYVLLDVRVEDPETYEEYKRMAAPAVREHGARFLVRGGAVETLEGDWAPERIVVLEFENAERARAWYRSATYTAAKALRQRASSGSVILVEGAPPA